MIKLLKLGKTAWIAFFIAFIAAFIMVSFTKAQETPEEKAQKHGITFPIAELNSCGSFSECRTYCEDPVNASACISYAKQKGFYEEEEADPKKEQILARAKEILGCDSYESCLSFCSVPSNYDKCSSFAKDEGLTGGHIEDPHQEQFLAKAKEVLGCDSPSSCEAYCRQEANYQKCSEFAKGVGLRGGEQHVGPGGCTSESTCRALCSDPNNFEICKGFQEGVGEQFQGPGGCNSEISCRQYCEQNPQDCGYVTGAPGVTPPPGYNPQEICNRTPNCAWNGTTCQCSGYTQPSGEPYPAYSPPPGSQYSPQPNYTPSGSGGSTGSYDPATECAKTSGCSWTGSSCQCSSSGGTSSGGSTSTENYSPYPESSPTVQGISIVRSFLEQFLNFLNL